MPQLTQKKKDTALKYLKYAIIAFAAVSIILFFYQGVVNINKFNEIDLTTYLRASDWLFSGENPYQEIPRRYIYPLFLPILLFPFKSFLQTPLLKATIASIWSLGLYFSFFMTLAANWKRIYNYQTLREALSNNVLIISIMVLIFHPSLQDELMNGQVNLFVMGATAAFFIFSERKKYFWAAVFLAIATAVKIAPGLCLLYILFNKKFRIALYFIPLVILFTLGLPMLVNSNTIDYYRFFITEVMPILTGAEAEVGFKSFSLISTISYLFNISWPAGYKFIAIGLLSTGLFIPVYLFTRKYYDESNFLYRLTIFAAIVTILPLTFPMSEAHHLLLQIIPMIVVLAYWQELIKSKQSLLSDRLSLLFIAVALGLQVGHGLKDTPIRLLSLISLYAGMLWLLKKLKSQKLIS